jgi:phosphoserine phosphatase
MPHVLTLVAAPGALDPSLLARCRAALDALGAAPGVPDILSEREAADIPFTGSPDQAVAAVRAALGGAEVDAIATPAEGRRKRLLVADMDSTIVTSETLDELAAHAGLKDRIAEITRRSMNGELDFRQALIERVGMLRGLDVSALEATWERTEMMPAPRRWWPRCAPAARCAAWPRAASPSSRAGSRRGWASTTMSPMSC